MLCFYDLYNYTGFYGVSQNDFRVFVAYGGLLQTYAGVPCFCLS
jgi:hypothetical protein